jgi:hypothetical protein
MPDQGNSIASSAAQASQHVGGTFIAPLETMYLHQSVAVDSAHLESALCEFKDHRTPVTSRHLGREGRPFDAG